MTPRYIYVYDVATLSYLVIDTEAGKIVDRQGSQKRAIQRCKELESPAFRISEST